MERFSLSTCLTALLCSRKSLVSTGRSLTLRLRDNYLRNLSIYIPWAMLCHLCFWIVPCLLLILNECKLWHFCIRSSILSYSLAFLGSSMTSQPTSLALDYSLISYRRLNTLVALISFSFADLFYAFNLYSIVLANSSEKAKAASEKLFVCFPALLTCVFLAFLSSPMSSLSTSLSLTKLKLYLSHIFWIFLRVASAEMLLLSWVNIPWILAIIYLNRGKLLL